MEGQDVVTLVNTDLGPLDAYTPTVEIKKR